LEAFSRQKLRKKKSMNRRILIFGFSLYSQKYSRVINDLYFISGL
jgi:hypothetical protein